MELSPDQISALVERRYGAVLHSLPLPADRLARLRALLVERQQATVDAANASLLTGLNPIRDLPTISRAITLAQVEIDTTLRREFGPEIAATLAEVDRTGGVHNTLADFSHLLTASPEPLQPEQEKQVRQILQAAQPPEAVPTDIGRTIFGGIDDRAPINRETAAALAHVLSPLQLAAVRPLLEQDVSPNSGSRTASPR